MTFRPSSNQTGGRAGRRGRVLKSQAGSRLGSWPGRGNSVLEGNWVSRGCIQTSDGELIGPEITPVGHCTYSYDKQEYGTAGNTVVSGTLGQIGHLRIPNTSLQGYAI